MKRILACIGFLTLVILLLGCEQNRESKLVGVSDEVSQQWGVLIYAAGNYPGDALTEPVEGSLSRAVSTLRELELFHDTQEVGVFACLSSAETNGEVGIYRISFHPQTDDRVIGSELLRNLGPVSTGDPGTLAEFLQTALDSLNADRYALVLAGNGDGWIGTMGDNTAPLGMPLSGLRSALDNVGGLLPDGKFDLLCMYSREMGSLETLVELRGNARYAVTYPLTLEQPHHLIVKEWFQDLISRPDLSTSDLGAYVIDAERLAQDLQNDVVLATLWNLESLGAVEERFERFAQHWAAVAPTHASAVTALRNAASDVTYFDSAYVDIKTLDSLLAFSPDFADSEYAEFRNAAVELTSSVSAAQIMKMASPSVGRFGGLSFYYPTGTVDSLTAQAYGSLRMGTVAPAWAAVIDSLATLGNSAVTISGQAYWPGGHEFVQPFFFVDTTLGGVFGTMATFEPLWSFVGSARDTIDYTASFDLLGADSLTFEFGFYIDRDDNGFDSGDSLGFWNNGSSNFTPVSVARGDVLEDYNITVRLRRP